MKRLNLLALILAVWQARAQTMPGMSMPPVLSPKAERAAPAAKAAPAMPSASRSDYVGKRVEYDL